MSVHAADDFEEIRKAMRSNAEAENRCICPKNEHGTRTDTLETCPAHGKWLGERQST